MISKIKTTITAIIEIIAISICLYSDSWFVIGDKSIGPVNSYNYITPKIQIVLILCLSCAIIVNIMRIITAYMPCFSKEYDIIYCIVDLISTIVAMIYAFITIDLSRSDNNVNTDHYIGWGIYLLISIILFTLMTLIANCIWSYRTNGSVDQDENNYNDL
jgi:hypothetical protein